MSGELGRLNIDITADSANFQSATSKAAYIAGQTMRNIEASVNNASKAMENLAKRAEESQRAVEGLSKFAGISASVYVGYDLFKDKIFGAVEAMANLKKQSEITGSSVEQLSRLSSAAKLTGVSIDDVSGALVKLSKGLAGSDNETRGAGHALQVLGISAKDANGNLKDSGVLYEEIAKKLSLYKDGSGKTAIAMDLMGKAGAQQLPIMKMLAETSGIQAKVTKEQAEEAHNFEVAMNRMTISNDEAYKVFARGMIPALTELAQKYVDNRQKLNDFANSAASGAVTLLDHSDAIWNVVKAYAGFKAVTFAVGLAPQIEAAYAKTMQLGASVKELTVGTSALSAAEVVELSTQSEIAAARAEIAAANVASNSVKVQEKLLLREVALAELDAAASEKVRAAALQSVVKAEAQLAASKRALIASEATQIAANNAATVSAEAYAVAANGMSAAEIRAAASTGILDVALTALGGPIGIIIGLLSAGVAAWTLFGDAGENSVDEIGKRLKSIEDQKRGYAANSLDQNKKDIETLEAKKKSLESAATQNYDVPDEFGGAGNAYMASKAEKQLKVVNEQLTLAKSQTDALTKAAEDYRKTQESLQNLVYKSTQKTDKPDPFIKDFDNLGKENVKLQYEIDTWDKYKGKIDQSQRAMLEFELAYGKFSEANRSREKLPPLTKGEQDQLRSLADGIDAKKLQKSSMSFSSENYDAAKNKQDVDISKRTKELQLLDKTAYEQIQIKNAIDQRAQAENAINKASQDAIQLTEKQKQAYFDLYQSYADQLNEVEAKKREISRDPYAQASISLKNYADSSTNLGAQIGNSLTSAFNKAESAATKFFETGKFNARAFGQELINMMIQVSTQQMFGNIMKLAAGGGSGMAGMMGGLFGGSGQVDPASYVTNPTSAGSFSGDAFQLTSFDVGTNQVPQDMVAQIHKGEMIVPKEFNPATSGMSGGDTHNIAINVNTAGGSNSSADSNKGIAMGDMIRSSVQQIIIEQKRPGGLLAA